MWKKSIIALGFSCVLHAGMADTTAVIFRHGEKPALGLGQINCQGLNRALALPEVLLSRFEKPVRLHAPNPAIEKTDAGASYAYIRPLATIEPTAVLLGMPVNIQYSMFETQALAKKILNEPGTHFVAWEHHLAVKLAKDLIHLSGSNPSVVPAWSDADFDSIYVVKVIDDGSAKLVDFERLSEDLNGLPQTCPVVTR